MEGIFIIRHKCNESPGPCGGVLRWVPSGTLWVLFAKSAGCRSSPLVPYCSPSLTSFLFVITPPFLSPSHCVSSSRSSALHINHMAGRIKQSICNSLAASLKDRQRSASITANASTSSAHGRVWVCVRAHVCVCTCINSNRWLEVHARTERGHEALKMDRYLVV